MRTPQKGVALVLVLWMLALLTIIASNFTATVRTETLAARNYYSAAQARTFADAGIQLAIYELSRTSPDRFAWKGDGTPHQIDLGGGTVIVTILDESAKIDINAASEILLKGILGIAGLSQEKSAAVLDAILDWRDTDSLRRANGAEEADYRAAGLKYRPANAPFESTEDLQRVLGMPPAAYRKIAGALTVYSKQAGVNPAFAPREVLLALPGSDPAQVDAYLELRRVAQESAQPAPPFPPGTMFAAGTTGVYGVRSEARLTDGTRFVREAVFRLAASPGQTVAYFSWREGEPVVTPAEQEQERTHAG